MDFVVNIKYCRCNVFEFWLLDLQFANKDGGLLLKDEFQGSATWAFELGSQSLVCPIVVEDLTPPRQLLIEVRLTSHRYSLC